MKSRFHGAIALALASIVGILISCSGGGSDQQDQILEDFDLIITANPDTGVAPLTVSFFAVPSGGIAPYTYAWDFNGDGVVDSNSSNGIHTYIASGSAKVTVTDANDKEVVALRTITVTTGSPPPADPAMTVSFDAEPQSGNVPFGSQFAGFVHGGVAPFHYAWDFNNDGITDSFEKDPYWIFEEVGVEVGEGSGIYVSKPLLQVTDSQGVTVTNFDDNNNDGVPDWDFTMTVNPPLGVLTVTANGNPLAGQAPLTVEFRGAAANGTGNYAYSWDFGDNNSTEFKRTSIATHTYVGQGTYSARVTVVDLKQATIEPDLQQPRPQDIISEATSAWITINSLFPQAFELEIVSDIVSGQVPFEVNFEAHTTNGTEPIQYNWDVFTDTTPTEDDPSIGFPPSLNPGAVITPHFTYRKNPTIHFGNVTDEGSYVIRCVAEDAAGNTTISDSLIRVTATPNTSFPYYMSNRPDVVAQTAFPLLDGTGTSTQAYVKPAGPTPMSARANPAVASHPTGLAFIIGGEILDENGDFEELVTQGDSMYMYVPESGGTHTGESSIGEFNTNDLGGGVIRLNDGSSPPFPGGDPNTSPAGTNDSPTMPSTGTEWGDIPGGFPGPGPQATNRSTGFNIVGSAAAVYIHEQGHVETNPAGAYDGARNSPSGASWSYPDSPTDGWGMDSGQGGNGLGVPVIFVLGGRTDATTPSDLVQKYYPYGFGTEEVYTQSIEFGFQTTGNQTDTWSTYFLRPDQDQYPDSEMGPPEISNRMPGSEDEIPTLPKAVYGLMAVAIESQVQVSLPSFPGGPSKNIFTFGGIDAAGSVQVEMRWWDTSLGSETGGGDEEEDGVFSVVTEPGGAAALMPSARAYGQAVVLPGSELQIALVGGVTDQGIPLDTIDIFTFSDAAAPSTGTWETFGGTLPEALEACGAGYLPGPGGEKWVMAFGGWTGEDYNSDVFSARVNSPGDLVIIEGVTVSPRSGIGAGQGGSDPISNLLPSMNFNRFVMVAGVDENGTDSVVEVFSLP